MNPDESSPLVPMNGRETPGLVASSTLAGHHHFYGKENMILPLFCPICGLKKLYPTCHAGFYSCRNMACPMVHKYQKLGEDKSMIRIVHIRAEDQVLPDGEGFAIFDTITNTFLSFSHSQVWDNWHDFTLDWENERDYKPEIERLERLFVVFSKCLASKNKHNEQWGSEILKDAIKNNGSDQLDGDNVYRTWNPGDETIALDGEFTSDQLEAAAWWMRNHNKKEAVNNA